MRVELVKDFRFEAAHRLTRVPQGHKCGRLHGHSFRLSVHIEGEVDADTGWLMDYAAIAAVVRPVVEKHLDHYCLNDLEGLENPTSENLLAWLWPRLKPALPLLTALELAETCESRCRYQGR